MTREKCWKCKKIKTNVKLRACDDRLCNDCYEQNETELRKLRGGVASAQISSISPLSATTSPLFMTQGRRNALAGSSSGTRSSSTSGTAHKTHRQATESAAAILKVVSSYARYGATAPKNDNVGEKDKDCSMSVEHCPLCDEMVNSSDSSLKCDICDSLVYYHFLV